MIFADIPAGTSVFLDANTLVYHRGDRGICFKRALAFNGLLWW